MGAHDIGTVLEPGKTQSVHFALDKFAMILSPGHYTVASWDGLGWNVNGQHPNPVATAKIEFTRPTPEHARARVHDLCTNQNRPGPFHPSQLAGETDWELRHLYDPAYLQPLREEATAGHVRACLGLGSIVALGANDTLLELSKSNDPEMVMTAAESLFSRLQIQDFLRSQQALREGLWQPKFDQPLRELAVRLLSGKLEEELQSKSPKSTDEPLGSWMWGPTSLGAVLLQWRVSPAEADAVLQAMDRELPRYKKIQNGGVFVPSFFDFEAPPMVLLSVVDHLRHQGWRIEDAGRFGKGSLLAFCRQLDDPAVPKPAGKSWEDALRAALSDPSPLLRENAVRAIPLPLTEEWSRLLRVALKDSDGDVLQAACEVAGKSGDKEMIDPVLQAITDGPKHILVPAAAEAAEKLGAGAKVWPALVETMTDEKKAPRAVQQLIIGTIDLPPLTGDTPDFGGWTAEELTAMRNAWSTFLEVNRAILESGRRVPGEDPSITPALIPVSMNPDDWKFSVRLTDSTSWPPWSK
jgi:hypothetical protein